MRECDKSSEKNSERKKNRIMKVGTKREKKGARFKCDRFLTCQKRLNRQEASA